MHYVLSGAGAFTDVSNEHEKDVPVDSLKFIYPRSSWFNFLNNAGFITKGGFVLASVDAQQANFTYINGLQNKMYTFQAEPRLIDWFLACIL